MGLDELPPDQLLTGEVLELSGHRVGIVTATLEPVKAACAARLGFPNAGSGLPARSRTTRAQDEGIDWLVHVGLGLDDDSLRLDRTTQNWVRACARHQRDVAERLAGVAARVEQIGSATVNGLVAKPIIDLAIGLDADQELTRCIQGISH